MSCCSALLLEVSSAPFRTFCYVDRASAAGDLGASRNRPASSRNGAPASIRLNALYPPLSSPDLVVGGQLPINSTLLYPDLAAGIDLEALPLWASFMGLLAANVAGLALAIALLRNLQDASELLTVVKVQVRNGEMM